MSSVRGRRGGAAAAGRRAGARGAARVTGRLPTGPVRTGIRSTAPSRPGRRTTRRPTRAAPGPRRRPLFSGRAVLLGALVLILALTLAGPVRQFLAGRAQLVELAAERSRLEQRAEALQAELDRQADPAYTARQARERLTYVLPGDRLVVVVDGDTVEGDAGTLPAGGASPATRPPWYEGLLESVATADGNP
jgi:cell division protein FtsB